jgi:hypothetical protein
MVLNLVEGARSIAKAYPQTAPKITELNSILREIGLLVMQHQQPAEPAAPPA